MTHIAIQERLDGRRLSGWKRSATNNTRNPAGGGMIMHGSSHEEPDRLLSRKGNNHVNGSIVNLPVGNTEVAAKMIQKLTGSDIFESTR